MRTTTYRFTGAAHPLRVAVIADFHDGDAAPVIDAVKEIAPDAIFVVGDVVHNAKRIERGMVLLRALIGIAPVFCSLGNHEFKCDGDIRARIRRTGVRLLDDGYTTLGGFVIGGLSSGYEGHVQGKLKRTPDPDWTWLDEFARVEGTHVLLSHHPEYYPRKLSGLPVELILSGHAHGGQWRFFNRGVFAPGQGILARFVGGVYRGRRLVKGTAALSAEQSLLLVSRGLANEVHIPRIGNPTELIVIEFAV